VITEPAKNFSRRFRGYDPAAVDAKIDALTSTQRLLRDDIDSLTARLRESGTQTAALRQEVAVLTDTSPSPHAVQQRLARMLRQAVDEVAEMQAEARAEADALIAAAQAEVEETERKRDQLLAEMTAEREAMEAEYQQAKDQLDAELASLRDDAEQARERLLAEAKQRADQHREEAERAVEDASRRRIRILEQLAGVYHDLETVPETLESAYREQKGPDVSPDAQASAPDRKVSTG
jgi:chromosome segregation ATPase